MNKFVKAIHAVIGEITALVECVFRSSEYQDILAHIDTRLDPQNPEQWFRDRPQEYSPGTSVFSDPNNAFQAFRFRLLNVMASDRTFFVRVDGELVAKKGRPFGLPFTQLLTLTRYRGPVGVVWPGGQACKAHILRRHLDLGRWHSRG